MIILSQNTLLGVRRAVIVSNTCYDTIPLWEASEHVLAANETLKEVVERYLDSGWSWREVKAAKAALARAVSQFEIQEKIDLNSRRTLPGFGVPQGTTNIHGFSAAVWDLVAFDWLQFPGGNGSDPL
jgi:hypothetical protein